MSQISIQFHEVQKIKWEPVKDKKDASEPRVLNIHTPDGVQRIAMFPERTEDNDHEQS